MHDCMKTTYGNASSIHKEGREARSLVERCRKRVAQVIGASIGEVFFTSGGTESNNTALRGAVSSLGVNLILTSPIEHHSVLHTVQHLQKTGRVKVVHLPANAFGRVDPAGVRAALENRQPSDKALVSVMHANNETGTLQPIAEIGAICEAFGVPFHSDTVQTMGYFPIRVDALHLSFCSAAAHKFYGPKGVGFLYANADHMIEPLLHGGSQERNMRGGTENLYGIVGLATALELANEEMNERREKTIAIRAYFREQLLRHFDQLEWNADEDAPHHYKVLSVSFPPSLKAELLLFNLDIAGIAASGGSACSSGVESGSHVLEALHPGSERRTVRFSFSHHNTRSEVDYTIAELRKLVGSQRAQGVVRP